MLRDARRRVGFTQVALAAAAGTSQPTIAAYEAGRATPTVATLERLLGVCGLQLDIGPLATPARYDRATEKSLAVHRAIAAKLLSDPEPVLAKARVNLARLRANDPAGHGRIWLDRWAHLLDSPIDEIVIAVLARTEQAADLRQMTPFAGVLTDDERVAAHARVANRRVARAS